MAARMAGHCDSSTSSPPTGDAALRLWDAVCAWLEFPHLYELQRPKESKDMTAIAETFRPYVEAHDWVSINRGEVVPIPKVESS